MVLRLDFRVVEVVLDYLHLKRREWERVSLHCAGCVFGGEMKSKNWKCLKVLNGLQELTNQGLCKLKILFLGTQSS